MRYIDRNPLFRDKADGIKATVRYTYRLARICIRHHSARTIGKALASGREISIISPDSVLGHRVILRKISGKPAKGKFFHPASGKSQWLQIHDILGWTFSPDFRKAVEAIEKEDKL